jgi:hypothetical protein
MTTNDMRWVARVAMVIGSLALPIGGLRALRAADPAAGAPQPAANPADMILGDWRPTDMDVTVRIFVLKGKYVGGVVKAANPQLVNTELLREIAYDTATNTWKGEIFAVKRGAFVPMTIRLTKGGFEMVAGSGIMSKTIEWVRAPVQAAAAVQPAAGTTPR